jgi:hypothetical protein
MCPVYTGLPVPPLDLDLPPLATLTAGAAAGLVEHFIGRLVPLDALADAAGPGSHDAAYRRALASGLAHAGPMCQHAASGDEEGLP